MRLFFSIWHARRKDNLLWHWWKSVWTLVFLVCFVIFIDDWFKVLCVLNSHRNVSRVSCDTRVFMWHGVWGGGFQYSHLSNRSLQDFPRVVTGGVSFTLGDFSVTARSNSRMTSQLAVMVPIYLSATASAYFFFPFSDLFLPTYCLPHFPMFLWRHLNQVLIYW